MILDEIKEEFLALETWEEKYEMLIELGNRLNFPESLKTQENKIEGCQSRVWLVGKTAKNGTVEFNGYADSMILRGLVYLLIISYNGLKPEQIAATEPKIINEINLNEFLSFTRQTGIEAIVGRIKWFGDK